MQDVVMLGPPSMGSNAIIVVVLCIVAAIALHAVIGLQRTIGERRTLWRAPMAIGVSVAVTLLIMELGSLIIRQLPGDTSTYQLLVNLGVFVAALFGSLTFAIRLIYRATFWRSLASASTTLLLLLGVAFLLM